MTLLKISIRLSFDMLERRALKTSSTDWAVLGTVEGSPNWKTVEHPIVDLFSIEAGAGPAPVVVVAGPALLAFLVSMASG